MKRLFHCTVVAVTLLASTIMVRAEDASKAKGFELTIATYTFRSVTVFESIDKTRECGVPFIEFHFWQPLSPEHRNVILNQDLPEQHVQALKEKLKAAGVTAINAYVGDSVYKKGAEGESSLRKLFGFAQKLGLRALTGEPPLDQLDLVEKMVKEHNIQWCFHNHPKEPSNPAYKNWDPAFVRSLLEKRDSRMGVSLDTGHLGRSGLDAVAATRLLKGRILSVHLKDAKEAQSHAEDVPLGQGVSKVRGVLAELKQQGYTGEVAIEYERESAQLMQEVKQCLDLIRSEQAKLFQ